MKVDATRLARALALVAWAGFFDWLWLSGEATSFVGPRTIWVVPFGAVVLTVSALAYLAGIRTREAPSRPSVGELLGLLALVAPIIAVLVVPNPSLGALAVERKESSRAATAARPPAPDGDYGLDVAEDTPEAAFTAIALVDQSPEFADSYGVYDGARVELVGLVSEAPAAPGQGFELSRFTTSCCAADAIPYTVRVKPGPSLRTGVLPTDTWVEVAGVVRRAPAGGFVLVAEQVTQREEPSDPYL